MNKIEAEVTSIKTKDSINLVKLYANGENLTLVTLELPKELKEKVKVKVIFKESEVAISKSELCEISISNQIKGVISEIKRGEVITMINLKTKAGDISAMITTASSERINLKVSDSVFGLIKANEMSMEIL